MKRPGRKGNAGCKEKQEGEDDRGKLTLQFLSLGGMTVLCILFLKINQSASAISPIKPVLIGFQSTTPRAQTKTDMSKQFKKRIKRSKLNIQQNAQTYNLSKKYRLRYSDNFFT